ncbi:MAG: 2Fe-2S iron-sulfur cluster binding domain-containing protein [Sphingosinicella sp.]|nr:2Fe-2S iron-sulfur cluster binding domain-containing protein [Sphingosinicella sp.]
MSQLIVVKRDGVERRLEGRPGLSVMELIREGGIDELLALCGGCCSCATCHVEVDEGWIDRLPPVSAEEDLMLGFADFRTAGSRLSCQVGFSEALDGLRLRIAPD